MLNIDKTKLTEIELKRIESYEQKIKSIEFHRKRFEETKKSIAETKELKININTIVLDLLEELGFDRTAAGTDYLADLIETLYYERRVFDGTNEFFDFDDKKNNHYVFTKDACECSVSTIQSGISEELAKSYASDSSLNEIIYGIVNDVISQYDKSGKALVLSLTK